MKRYFLGLAALAASAPAYAQDVDHSRHQGHAAEPAPSPAPPSPSPAEPADPHAGHMMPDQGSMDRMDMDHAAMGHMMDMTQESDAAPFALGSGTARLPGAESHMSGLHVMAGEWMLMAHGYVWAVHSDQGGPRGDSKTYVQSMLMANAERPLGDGAKLTLKSMWSLEPIMSARGYPNLFATGETAGGEPLIDRQHPHDFFMELAARVDVELGGGVSAFVYGGPVGEPALGPTAFMMRRSARYNPEAPISHHWFDSTHITYGVATAGLYGSQWQVEGSAFRGREPDEDRWGIETPRLDSWSARGTWNPTPNWSAQVSYGRIKEPEALHHDEDEGRMTASLSYSDARLAVTAAFSAKDRIPGSTLTAWMAEANWNPAGGHNLSGESRMSTMPSCSPRASRCTAAPFA